MLGRFAVSVLLVAALFFVRPVYTIAACGGIFVASSGTSSFEIVNCNTLTTVVTDATAYSRLSYLTVVIDGGSLLHAVQLDFSGNATTFPESTVQHVLVRYQNVRITRSAPFSAPRTVVTLNSAFARNVTVVMTNLVLQDPTIPLINWLAVRVEELSIVTVLISGVTIDSVVNEALLLLQSTTCNDVRVTILSSQLTLWSDTVNGKLAFLGHSVASNVPRHWGNVDLTISDSTVTTKYCTPHPALPMPVVLSDCGPVTAEHRIIYFLISGVFSNVSFTSIRSALTITTTNVSSTNVEARVIEFNTVGDERISQLAGRTSLTFVSTDTTVVGSQAAQMTNVHYYTQAQNMTFALRGGRHIMSSAGNLSRTDLFRSSELFRFTNLIDVYNLQVDVRDAVFDVVVQCGIPDAVVGTYVMAGIVAQLLHLGGNVSGGYVSVSNITADVTCPDGLFSPNLNASAPGRITGITTGLAVAMVERKLLLRNLTWELAAVSLRVTVGYDFVNPVGYVTAGFIYNIVALVYLRCSVLGGTMSITNSHVVAWYRFGSMLLVAPRSSTQPSCFVVNGFNATHLLAFTDDATLINLCGSLSTDGPQLPLTATDFTASIVNSTVAQPNGWSAPADLLAVMSLPTIMTNCRVHVEHSGSPSTVPSSADFSAVSVTPPAAAAVACQACTAAFSTVTVSHSPRLAGLLLATVQAAVIQDSTFGLHDSQVIPVSAFDGGPSLSRFLHVTYMFPSNSLTLQRVAFVLYNTTISSLVPFADKNTVTYRSSSVELQCVNFIGTQVVTHALLDAYLLNSSVSRVGMARTLTDCENRTIPATTPAPAATAAPPQTAVERAAATSTSTTVVASGALVSALSVPTGFGTVPALQMSASVTRIASRLFLCVSGDDATPSPSAATTPAAADDDDDQADDTIGSQIADNPTRVRVGGRLGYAGGAVIGNALLVVAGGVVIALVQHACAVVRRAWNGRSWTCAIRLWDLCRRVIASAVPLYGVLVQPTAAAAVTLIADYTHTGPVVLGVVALIVAAVPLVVAAAYLMVRFPLVNKFRLRRPTEGRVFRFFTSGTYWATPPGNPNAPTLLRAKAILHLFHCLLEPYRAPYQWMFVVETGSAYLQGIVVGVAVQFAPDVPCPYIEGPLWALFSLSIGVSLVMLLLRPTATPFDWVLSAVMNAWSAVVIVLTLQREDAIGALLTMVQAITSLVLLMIPVVLAVAEVLGLAVQRASSTVEATLSGSGNAEGGVGVLGVPWADTLNDEELLEWHKQRTLEAQEHASDDKKNGTKKKMTAKDEEVRKFQRVFELNPELLLVDSNGADAHSVQQSAGGAVPLSPDESALYVGSLAYNVRSGAAPSLLCRSSSPLLRALVSPRNRRVVGPSVSLLSASSAAARGNHAATLKRLLDVAATARRLTPSTASPLSPTQRLVVLNDIVQLICDLPRRP